jgi:pimeloyl-ACP methyl ester carboxylesterase
MFYRAADARLHAAEYGTAHGSTPVVLVHGLGGSSRSWGALPEALAARCRVAALDLRGCGKSERGSAPISLARLAVDVVGAIDALGVKRAHLVGHSLGGVIVQEILVRHAERCATAVLISTSASVGRKATANWRRLADTVEARGEVGESGATRGFSELFAVAHPSAVQEYAALSSRCDAAVYAAQARAASQYDYTAELANVTQPVLVIQGLADRLTSPGGSVLLARALPNGELLLVDGVGHNLHIEMGVSLAATLDAFVRRHDDLTS